jgi:hypothetical protein
MVNTAKWQTQGFPSAEAANLVTTVANAATPPTARNGCLMALIHSLAPPKTKDPHVNWPAQVVQETPVLAHLTLPESNKRSRQDSNYHTFSLWAQEWGVNARWPHSNQGRPHSNDGVSRDIPGRPGRSNAAGRTNCLHGNRLIPSSYQGRE